MHMNEHIAKTISDMKKHIAAKNNDFGLSSIFHVKMDRNNDNEADWKEYKQNELFKKMQAIYIYS